MPSRASNDFADCPIPNTREIPQPSCKDGFLFGAEPKFELRLNHRIRSLDPMPKGRGLRSHLFKDSRSVEPRGCGGHRKRFGEPFHLIVYFGPRQRAL
jgi:hypothetical protein